MNLQEMIEKTKKIIETLRGQGLPGHACDGSLSLISSNECQIALENLCENIYEYDISLAPAIREQLTDVMDFFEIKERYRDLV